ncbi:MAG: enoyl-CoA hydratase/isomerase family protein [Candidatus Methanomethylicia archaeon]
MGSEFKDYETIELIRENGIAIVRFNRPDVLNALNLKMREELLKVMYELKNDSGIRVVIFTGAGRGFSAGADIKDWKDIIDGKIKRDRTFVADFALAIKSLGKPTIAAVNGPAFGFGFTLTQLCDFVIASEKAVFSAPFVKRGIPPELGSTLILPRTIGFRKARQILLLGRVLDANTAKEMGLVDEIVPEDKLMEKCIEIARELIENSPLAIEEIEKLLWENLSSTLEETVIREVKAADYLYQTEDFKEATIAFLEKRKPKFKGK